VAGPFGERERREISARRVIAGVFLTSVLLPVIFILVAPVVFLGETSFDPSQLFVLLMSANFGFLVYLFLATLAPTVLIGMPLYIFYRRWGWYRLFHHLIGGAFAGLVYCLVLGGLVGIGSLLAYVVVPAMMLGAVAAFICWLVVVWRSPRVVPVEEISRIFA